MSLPAADGSAPSAGATTTARDALTGLLTRDELIRRLDGLPSGDGHLLMLDLDGFRPVNEALGYDAGDELLVEAARRLLGLVPGDALVARTVADAFVIHGRHLDAGSAEHVAMRLLRATREPFSVADQLVHLTASIGIAPHDHPRGHELLRAADIAVHRAKTAGGDRTVWYDAALADDVADHLRLAAELREAVDAGQLVVHYQPCFDLRTGACNGAEALVRWEHPARGLIHPGTFIPTAERTGVIDAIGSWVLDTVLGDLAADRPASRGGHRPRPTTTWLNVAVPQLSGPGFAHRVVQTIQQAGLAPTAIGIEVTESAVSQDMDTVVAELEQLQQLGVRVALDDFGTGYSSLSRLRDLPIDLLKIDRSFVTDLDTRAGRATVAAIMGLGHAIDAQVIAEGVESEDQLRTLRTLGVDQVSGFLLARPVPRRQLEEVAADGLERLRRVLDDPATVGAAPRRRWLPPGRWPRAGRGPQAATTPSDADVDGLTGLGTRRAALAHLASAMGQGRAPVLLLVELDSFRAACIMRGEHGGETLLRAEAASLAAIEGARAYRFHEALFALVLDDARRGPIEQQLDLVALARGPKGMTACVGIARAGRSGDAAELEARAEDALAIARRRGIGSVVHDQDPKRPVPLIDPVQARALHRMLREGWLRVHYQPIVSLEDGATIGFEALARPQADHGIPGPTEAFELARALELVPELDEICRRSIFLDGPGFDMPVGSRLFVNVAPEALGHRSLSRPQLHRQLEEAGLDPRRVVFELRPAATADPALFASEARRLAERGFVLALDGAGGDDAGLRALRAAPFRYAKLDPQLPLASIDDAGAAATLRALFAFAAHADVHLIATGVQDARTLRRVRQLRAHEDHGTRLRAAQGFQLGVPLPRAQRVRQPED